MSNFFVTQVDDGYGGSILNLTPMGYAVIILLLCCLLIITSLFSKTNKQKHFNTKQLVFSALAITLGMVTSYMKLFSMPMGGSVTLLSMFFITLIGYWYGLKAGLTASIAYGLLQMIVDPYMISIPQIFFDYIFAYGALGLSGLFSKKKHGLWLGFLVGVSGRLFFSVLSGIIFFAMYAPETMNPLVYSLAYNGSFLGAETILTIFIISLPPVQKSIAQVTKLANTNITS
jgi:thiamine transporter